MFSIAESPKVEQPLDRVPDGMFKARWTGSIVQVPNWEGRDGHTLTARTRESINGDVACVITVTDGVMKVTACGWMLCDFIMEKHLLAKSANRLRKAPGPYCVISSRLSEDALHVWVFLKTYEQLAELGISSPMWLKVQWMDSIEFPAHVPSKMWKNKKKEMNQILELPVGDVVVPSCVTPGDWEVEGDPEVDEAVWLMASGALDGSAVGGTGSKVYLAELVSADEDDRLPPPAQRAANFKVLGAAKDALTDLAFIYGFLHREHASLRLPSDLVEAVQQRIRQTLIKAGFAVHGQALSSKQAGNRNASFVVPEDAVVMACLQMGAHEVAADDLPKLKELAHWRGNGRLHLESEEDAPFILEIAYVLHQFYAGEVSISQSLKGVLIEAADRGYTHVEVSRTE